MTRDLGRKSFISTDTKYNKPSPVVILQPKIWINRTNANHTTTPVVEQADIYQCSSDSPSRVSVPVLIPALKSWDQLARTWKEVDLDSFCGKFRSALLTLIYLSVPFEGYIALQNEESCPGIMSQCGQKNSDSYGYLGVNNESECLRNDASPHQQWLLASSMI